MAHAEVWWQRHWIRVTESFIGHVAAIVLGLALIVLGLGLGVTMIMLPAGIVIGLLGVAMVVGGFFARANDKQRE